MEPKTSFVIFHTEKKRIMGLCFSPNDGREFCNANTVELDSFETGVLFRAETLEHAKKVLMGPNPGWYNSSADCPIVSDHDRPFLVILKVTETFEEIKEEQCSKT